MKEVASVLLIATAFVIIGIPVIIILALIYFLFRGA